MLSEEALKCYYSPGFRWKMVLLAAAVLFYFTIHRRALLNTDRGAPTLWARAAAVISRFRRLRTARQAGVGAPRSGRAAPMV